MAGYAMQHAALASPLYIGATVKVTCDVLLYAPFHHLKPPKERAVK
jgi:hypothetical protein